MITNVCNLPNAVNLEIQFTPGHKNKDGNDSAHLAANAAHSNPNIETIRL